MSEINNVNFKNMRINLNNLNGGLRRKDMQTDIQRSIFDKIDANSDQILTDSEIANFTAQIDFGKNQDGMIERGEANNYLKSLDSKLTYVNENGKEKGVGQDDLMAFLNDIETLSNQEGVKSAEMVDGNLSIEYDNGNKKVIDPESNDYTLTEPTADGSKVSHYDCTGTDEQGNPIYTLEKTVETTSTGTIETKFEADGETISSIVETAGKEGNYATTTINFTDGQPSGKEVRKGQQTDVYDIDANGNEVLLEQRMFEGDEVNQKITFFSYPGEGYETRTIHTQGNVIVQNYAAGVLCDETITDSNGNLTGNVYSDELDGNGNPYRLSSSKNINGQTFTVEYDGNGNTTGIVVQYKPRSETPEAICKKFNCTIEDLQRLNPGQLHKLPNGNGYYFMAGAEITVPGEIEADDVKLTSRQTSEQVRADYSRDADQVNAVLNNHQILNGFENTNCSTYLELARELYRLEGNSNPTNMQLDTRMQFLMKNVTDSNGNPVENGKLKGLKLNVPVSAEYRNQVEEQRFAERSRAAAQQQRAAQQRQFALKNNIVYPLHGYIGEHSSAINDKKFFDHLFKINEDNVVEVLNLYETVYEESLFKQILGESSGLLNDDLANGKEASQEYAVEYLVGKLLDAADNVGVGENAALIARQITKNTGKEVTVDGASFVMEGVRYGTLGALLKAYVESMPDTGKVDRYADSLVNIIQSATVYNNPNEEFDFNSMARGVNAATDGLNAAASEYYTARADEGWTAALGDNVCGIFGCKTVDDMNALMAGTSIKVKAFIEWVNKHKADLNADSPNFERTYAEFKTKYKATYGVEFSPSAMKAREIALNDYSDAVRLEASVDLYTDILNQFVHPSNYNESISYKLNNDFDRNHNANIMLQGGLTALRSKMKLSDEEVNGMMRAYAQSKGMTWSDVKGTNGAGERSLSNSEALANADILHSFLKDGIRNARLELNELLGNRTMDQMRDQARDANEAVYGTECNMMPEVKIFNENMETTEMVTGMVTETLISSALTFVPGGAAWAATRIASLTAKGTRMASIISKAARATSSFSNVLNVTKTGQYARTTVSNVVGSIATYGETNVRNFTGGVGSIVGNATKATPLTRGLANLLGGRNQLASDINTACVESLFSAMGNLENVDSVSMAMDAAASFVFSRVPSLNDSLRSSSANIASATGQALLLESTVNVDGDVEVVVKTKDGQELFTALQKLGENGQPISRTVINADGQIISQRTGIGTSEEAFVAYSADESGQIVPLETQATTDVVDTDLFDAPEISLDNNIYKNFDADDLASAVKREISAAQNGAGIPAVQASLIEALYVNGMYAEIQQLGEVGILHEDVYLKNLGVNNTNLAQEL